MVFARKTIQVWKNGDLVMGIVTWHSNPNGLEMVVRMLREPHPDGDLIWDIDHIRKPHQTSLPLSTKTEETS